MNTDTHSNGRKPDIATQASDPRTDPSVLRIIAYEYPALRAKVALNPAAYEGLIQWLDDIGDEAVKAAVHQRRESGPVYPTTAPHVTDTTPPVIGSVAAVDNQEPDSAHPDESEQPTLTAAVATGAVGATTAPTVAPAPSSQEVFGPQPKEEEKRTRSPYFFLILLLTLFALLLAAVVIYFATRSPEIIPEPTPSPTETASPTQSEEPSEEPREEPSEEPSEEPTEEPEPLYPAPEGAIETSALQSPTGNLVCNLSGDRVLCTALETYDSSSFLGNLCPTGYLSVEATETGVNLACGQVANAADAITVDYGTYAQYDDVACMSTFSGMTCWNTMTGQSIAIARSGWQSGETGPIAESSFRWN
ncbi:MAG: hypothetical protein Q4P71_03090 [Actinomycetaceae bacterium]|nr:hypothetical protein [Actinomycetaceae bacterium]